jgi:hypothetical protein
LRKEPSPHDGKRLALPLLIVKLFTYISCVPCTLLCMLCLLCLLCLLCHRSARAPRSHRALPDWLALGLAGHHIPGPMIGWRCPRTSWTTPWSGREALCFWGITSCLYSNDLLPNNIDFPYKFRIDIIVFFAFFAFRRCNLRDVDKRDISLYRIKISDRRVSGYSIRGV